MASFQEWSAFYDTDAWDHLRRETLRRYGCVCMACGATDTEIHVDHIRPRSMYPHLSMDPNNLQVLCRACNFSKGSRVIDYRQANPDMMRERHPVLDSPNLFKVVLFLGVMAALLAIAM